MDCSVGEFDVRDICRLASFEKFRSGIDAGIVRPKMVGSDDVERAMNKRIFGIVNGEAVHKRCPAKDLKEHASNQSAFPRESGQGKQ